MSIRWSFCPGAPAIRPVCATPWSGQVFLGGGAGSILDKMQLQPRDGRPDYSYNCPGLCIGTCRYF
jgi:hypothetical protein